MYILYIYIYIIYIFRLLLGCPKPKFGLMATDSLTNPLLINAFFFILVTTQRPPAAS